MFSERGGSCTLEDNLNLSREGRKAVPLLSAMTVVVARKVKTIRPTVGVRIAVVNFQLPGELVANLMRFRIVHA